MNRNAATGAHLRAAGRCALTGVLVSLLAVPSFAQGAQPSAAAETTTPATAATALETTSSSTPLPLIAADADIPDLGPLGQPAASGPEDPQPIALSSLPDLHEAMKDALANQGQQLTSTKQHHGVQRPGMLVLGIVGGAAMGMGGFIYALNGSAKARALLGTMFMAPGAVAAGFGFTYAFKPHKR